MFKRFFISFLFFSISLNLFISSVSALSFPKPSGYVNDFANILSSETKKKLEDKLIKLEKDSSVEIAVVTVSSLEDTTIEDYAVRLFEDWKIGKKDKENGVLLLVAPNEKEVRIEVGYGLEPQITDSRAGRIIRQIILPEFKKEDYNLGVVKGTEAIVEIVTTGETYLLPAEEEPASTEDLIPFMFIFGGILFTYLSAFLGRTKEIWPGGAIGGAIGGGIGWFILKSLFTVFVLGLTIGLLGLLLDFIISRNFQIRKKRGLPTSWTNSWGGFSSGSGGGFSGFGGGSSGGGGASGSW